MWIHVFLRSDAMADMPCTSTWHGARIDSVVAVGAARISLHRSARYRLWGLWPNPA